MSNINSEDFIQTFNTENYTVGTIGYGFIGNAVVELFRDKFDVIVYDKAGYDGKIKPLKVVFSESVDTVVKNCQVIFVAVPTPMKKSGECHTGIVESVLQDIQNAAIRCKVPIENFIVVLKSTIPPGFTKKMQDKYALRIVFSPEFLTEANAVQDFKTTNRVILGGDIEDARVVFKFFEAVWPDRLAETYVDNPHGIVNIIQCDSTEAEMVKLSTNIHLTSKVMISNELYLICQKLGVEYNNVKILTQLDQRIGFSHMNVPGPDGNLGYGGHCFVKDTQNLSFISENLGISSNNLFKSLHQRNLEIREDRNWEEQKGRAVIDDEES